MNKFINALLLFILFPLMLLTIFVGFDLPIEFLKTTGKFIPYLSQTFLVFGILIGLINIRRSVRRWSGIILMSKETKYKWISSVSKERKKRVVVYNLMEGVVMLFIGYSLYTITSLAIIPACAYALTFVDNLIFTMVGIIKNIWKIGLTTKALVHTDREVNIFYFNGLKKIEIHLDSLFFEYKNGLKLDIPTNCISKEEENVFYKTLESLNNTEKVYFQNIKK